jgi:hypothetical protein
MTSISSGSGPASPRRSSRSMLARKAASVLPEPVGAEIRVSRPAMRLRRPGEAA